VSDLRSFLKHKAYNLRVNSILSTTEAGAGHPTSCLSAADLLAVLFFYVMRHYDDEKSKTFFYDHFILSKGHAAPLLYAVWKELGVLTEQDLLSLRKFGSILEGHPTPRFDRVKFATGSLGCGLSIGAGVALADKIDKKDSKAYVLLGDSEVAEGSIWEAAEIAAHYKLDNLIAILDCNRLGQTTETLEGWDTRQYVAKFEAFGWETFVVDGHRTTELIDVFNEVKISKNKPSIIIAKTIKGYGVESVENKLGFHGKVFAKSDLDEILHKLKKRFEPFSEFKGDYDWKSKGLVSVAEPKNVSVMVNSLSNSKYKLGEQIATRFAFGEALVELGKNNLQVVTLDAEVNNSTFTNFFKKDFPERFIECFIAEQNMVGMATGMNGVGKIPFVSTFAAFLTRSFDQIRMAAMGRSTIKLVGSHAGVSVGSDGPSQMGLEDIAMMRSIPNSMILYPCDAVSTYHAVSLMAQYNKGISYLRTTRSATSVIYENSERFEVGKCKILKQSGSDIACLVAAGITVFEALKAYDVLKKEGLNVSVVDLFSVKPLDESDLLRIGLASGGKIITVEDHYRAGGLGESVCCALKNSGIKIEILAVDKLPMSGSQEELLNYEGIDAKNICDVVRKIVNS